MEQFSKNNSKENAIFLRTPAEGQIQNKFKNQ